MAALTCFCRGHCPDSPLDPLKNGTCQAKEGAYCFTAVEEVLDPITMHYVPEQTYGCMPPDETGFLQCKGHLVPHLNPTSIGCCSDQDYCNLNLSPMYKATPESEQDTLEDHYGPLQGPNNMHYWALLCSLIVLLCLAIVVIILLYNYYKKKEESH